MYTSVIGYPRIGSSRELKFLTALIEITIDITS